MSPRSLLSDSIEEFIFVIIHLNLHDLIMFVVYVVILAISCYYFRSPIINNLHIPFFLGHCQARCPMVLGVYVCIVYCPTPFFYGLFGTTLRLYRELQQLESQSNANRSSRRLWGGRSWWKMGRWHLKRIWWSDLPIFWDMKKRFGVRFRWFFVYIILFSLYRKTHVFLLRRKSWDYYSHLISGIFVQILGWRMLQKNWRLVTWWQVTLNIFQPDTLWRICGRYLYHCILMYLLYYIIFIYLFIDILNPWVCSALTATTKHVATNFTRKYQEWWSWWPLRCKIRVELHGDSVDSSPLEGLSALPSWALRIIFVEFILMCESTVWVKQDLHIYNNMHGDAYMYEA